MPTSNPALSEKAFERVVQSGDLRSGWGASRIPPSSDVASPWTPATPTRVMTVNGAATATGVLLVLLCATAVVSWQATESNVLGGVELPAMAWGGLIGGLVFAIATIVKPAWARVTGPLYALSEGLFIGAISKAYNSQYDGIVVNAVACTVGVLAVMLFLHVTRIIKVTDKFRTVVMCATGAIFLVYLFSIGARLLFDAQVPLLHDTGPLGIGISLAIVVIAALNLSLDFDFIEKATAARAPKSTEWYAAFGLLVTLVWLYLELLRLLSKLQSRN